MTASISMSSGGWVNDEGLFEDETVAGIRVLAPAEKDTFQILVPNDKKEADGVNNISVYINEDREIAEGCIQNNIVTEIFKIKSLCESRPEVPLSDTIAIPPEAFPYVLNAGNDGDTYVWSTGETNTSISIDDYGFYSVEVTDTTTWCKTIQSVSVIVYTDIPNLLQIHEHSIKLYPNPTSGKLFIEGLPAVGLYKIYTLKGQIVQEAKLNGQNNQVIDLKDGLNNDLYLIQIVSDKGIWNSTFVLQKHRTFSK